jgi:hypothetical protein
MEVVNSLVYTDVHMDIMPSVTFVWAKKVALGCGDVFRYFLTFGGVKRKTTA